MVRRAFSVVAIIAPIIMLSIGMAVFIHIMHSYNMEYWMFGIIVVLMMVLLALMIRHDIKRWRDLEQKYKEV